MINYKDIQYDFDEQGETIELEGYRTTGCGCCSEFLHSVKDREKIIEHLMEQKSILIQTCKEMNIDWKTL